MCISVILLLMFFSTVENCKGADPGVPDGYVRFGHDMPWVLYKLDGSAGDNCWKRLGSLQKFAYINGHIIEVSKLRRLKGFVNLSQGKPWTGAIEYE